MARGDPRVYSSRRRWLVVIVRDIYMSVLNMFSGTSIWQLHASAVGGCGDAEREAVCDVHEQRRSTPVRLVQTAFISRQ